LQPRCLFRTATNEENDEMKRLACWAILGCLLAAPSPLPGYAQSTLKPAPPILTESLVGRDLYVSYCAGCHGSEGKGDGPVGRALNVRPADLTTIARRYGSYQPALVEATLNGTRPQEPSTAHGTREMPIWGALFRQLDTKESVARVRVQNLVKYVQTIQTPP
jgi:mono/diheme cytochrome c family protein